MCLHAYAHQRLSPLTPEEDSYTCLCHTHPMTIHQAMTCISSSHHEQCDAKH